MGSKVGQYFTLKGLISKEYLTFQVIVYEEMKPFQVIYRHFAGH